MFNHYEFTEATPFVEFLNENKDKLIGQTIRRIYANGSMVDEPIVIEFERFCIVIEYWQTSNITLFVIDTASFKKDPSLNFIYKMMNEASTLSYTIYPYEVERFNYAHTTITDIYIERCNCEIEINPATITSLKPVVGLASRK